MADFHKQRVPDTEQTPVVVLNSLIDTVVGQTATVLTRPTRARFLYLMAEVDAWRLQLGNTNATIIATAPAATTSDGSGSFPIR